MIGILERNRNRLITAKMAEVAGQGYLEPVMQPDGSKTTVELDADIIRKALVKLFEQPAFASMPCDEDEASIISHYGACVTRSFEKLSPRGNQFISGLLENLVEQAFYARGNI